MRILRTRTLHGPNVFAMFPVLRMTVDLEAHADASSADIPGFTDRLLAAIPTLESHGCSRRRPGGFVERLREGTYLGHITEHVALELSALAGMDTTFGKTVYGGRHGVYDIAVEFENERAMERLLERAVDVVNAAVLGRASELEPGAIQAIVDEAKAVVADTALGPSTRALVRAAEARGIPCSRLNDQSLVVLGYGKYRKFLQATTSSRTSFVATEIAGDKQLTKNLLDAAGIPVPRGRLVASADDAVAALAELGGPVVVKPLDGNHGNGVSVNLTREEDVRVAFELAREYRSRVLVEEMVRGNNYRVLVVDGRMVAASERLPAHVVGDGRHTVAELLAIENQNPQRAPGHLNVLTTLEVDEIVKEYLARAGRSLDDVPAAGEVFLLRESANLSTGGTARDVTDEMHPMTARLCERAARAIDLDICGIDLIAEDIRRPLTEQGAIVELNAAPGIRMHEHPSDGTPRDVAGAIVESLYPPGSPSRIPIVSITGTNGKTTTARMIGSVLTETGKTVGLTSTEGIYVGGVCVAKADASGPKSARTVLLDPTVDVAVLETARGGIVRRGLGYDRADVAVLTNIQPDHLGQDGIEDLEDLLWVKSLVAEAVRDHGTVVLNAEDPHLVALAESPRLTRRPKRIVFFAVDPANDVLRAHLRAGGTGYTVKNGWIVEADGKREQLVVRVADVPATFDGTATFHVANALASVAATRALGAPVESITRALSRFDHGRANGGRTNLYRVSRGHVLVDYGHNPASLGAVVDMTRAWGASRRTAVLSVPGDRADELLREAVLTAARGVDALVLKDDRDPRGRAVGELPAMLARIVEAEVPACACHVVVDEAEAVRFALERMQDDELVVVFTDDSDGVGALVAEAGGLATSAFTPGDRASDIRMAG